MKCAFDYSIIILIFVWKDHQLLPVSVGTARAPGLYGARARGSGETSRGDISLPLTSSSPSPGNPSISTHVTIRPSLAVARQQWLALEPGLALHPARSSDAGVTLIRWVSICYGGGGRRRGGGVPPVSAEALLCIPAERTDTHSRSRVPGWKTCCMNSQLKIRREEKSCSARVFYSFSSLLSLLFFPSSCGMVYIFSGNFERRWFMSDF